MANVSDAIPIRTWMQRSDALVAIAILCIVIMMIVPLPPFVLDFFLAGNLMLAVVVILSVMYIERAIDFSVFPSLLLIATVFRLGINVSTTRMILLGRGDEIGIIKAFGSFVVGGNYIVGIVIFLILVMIQFMVIVKGTTRVSEVAARFTLDAMPGKQMAIDADLNAGLITEEEAIAKRDEIRREADFYGAMDGACKFVQGDVMAGLIITIINIVGGLLIGIIMLKMDIMTAAKTFTILTIGDGLVAQIPALLISVSTGLIVTRAAATSNLGIEMTESLFTNPKVLSIAAGFIGALGIFTPLPAIPLVGISLGMAFLAYAIWQGKRAGVEVVKEAERAEEVEEARKPESVVSLLQVDPMELEIGYSLIPLVDPEQGGDLLDRVTMIRRQSALDLGLVVPPIRIRDNMQLKPNEYVVKIRGVQVAKGSVKVDHYLAMNPGTATEEIEGEDTIEPTFGLPAKWITEAQRERAEMAGYTVVDPPSIIATHLTEIVRRHAPEILSRQEVKTLIDNIKETYPAVVEELIPNIMSIGEVQKILHNLLREEISIRDLPTILETLADYAPKTKDPAALTEYVRLALARQICNQYQTEDGKLLVITLSPRLEEMIGSSIQKTPDGERAVLPPDTMQKMLQSLQDAVNKAAAVAPQTVVLCSPRIRRFFKDLVARAAPTLIVMSYNEVVPDVEIQSIGMVDI